MNRIKRITSWVLVLCVMMTLLPGVVMAEDTELVNIRVSDGHTEGSYRVLFKNNDIYFSAEDFGRITRYTFTKSANYGYQLGRKIIIVNPNDGDINIPVLHYTGNIGEVIMVDGTTYLSASQMLPWMNVTCRVEDGIFIVIPDKISLWQIVDDLSYDDYMFNLYSEYGDSVSSVAGLSAMIVFDGIINFRFDRLIPSDENGSAYNYECYVQALADAGPNFVTEGVLEDIEKYVDVSKGLDPFVEYLGVKLEGGLNNLGDYLSDLGLEEMKIQEILKISDTWEEIRQCVSVPGVITEYYNIFEAFKTYELIIGTDNEYREYLAWLSERGTDNTTFDRALDEAQTLLDENKGVITTLTSEFTGKLLEDTFLVVPGEVFQAIANNAIDDATITKYAGLASGFEYINSLKAYIEVSKAIFTLAFPEMVKGYEGIAKAAPLETIQDYCWLLAGSLQNEDLTEETIVHIRQSYLTALKTSRQLFIAQQQTMDFGFLTDWGWVENYTELLEPQLKLIEMKIQQLIASADSTRNDSVEGKQEYTDKLKEMFADSKFVDSMLVSSLITIIEAKCTCGLDEYGGDSNNPWLFEIPQINLESDGINEINQEIMSKYSSLIHDCAKSDPYDYPSYSSVGCEYSVSGDILSLVIKAPSSDCDVVDYDVYNISIKDKCAVNKDVVIAEAGMPVDEYRNHVKYVLGSEFWDNYVFLNGGTTEELPLEYLFMMDQMLQDTISPTNIDAARPFIASNGSLCVVGRFFFDAGGGEFEGIYNLEDYEISPYYSETLDYQKPVELMRIEMSWDGTDENGNLMYLNVDFSGTMDDGSWVQINDWSFTYDEQGQPIAHCERNQAEGTITYYLYNVGGLFNYVVSVDVGTSDYFSMIGDSGVKAVVTYPDGKTYNYTLDEGTYRGNTGYWFWAPFSIDHGTLAEYNAS